MFDKLFRFPVILVDGAQEMSKSEKFESMGIEEETYPEYVEGEAICPYDDFSHIVDMWLPTEDSYENAKMKVFDACMVTFTGCGPFMVPLPKEEFLKNISKFGKKFEEEEDEKIERIKTAIQAEFEDLDVKIQKT